MKCGDGRPVVLLSPSHQRPPWHASLLPPLLRKSDADASPQVVEPDLQQAQADVVVDVSADVVIAGARAVDELDVTEAAG